MKQPKKLTRDQKQIVSVNNLNPKEWMLIEDLGSYLSIFNKSTGATKRITKYPKKVR